MERVNDLGKVQESKQLSGREQPHKEIKQMLLYMQELKKNYKYLQLFVAPDWNPENSSWTATYVNVTSDNMSEGYMGIYYNMPVYVFKEMESHTCCVLPIYK